MLHSILKDKIPDYAELEIFFFEKCPLSCVHCFQNHKSTVGMSREEIMSKVSVIESFYKRNSKEHVIANVMGGELFSDDLIEKGYLDIYSDFINEIDKLGKKTTFNFVSALTQKNTTEFVSWLKKHNIKLSVSYDLTGRFNKENLLQFKKNSEVFKEHIRTICLVATKQNMYRLMEQGDEYYDYLYRHFDCYWDQLTPGPTVPSRLVPSERDLYNFNIFCIENYPKVTNLDSFLNMKDQNKMICPSINKLLVEANNKTSSCRVHQHDDSKDFISPVEKTNDPIIQKFLDDHNCLTCEYFKKCPFSCFVRHDWKRLDRDFDGCVYKETFRYVESRVDKSK